MLSLRLAMLVLGSLTLARCWGHSAQDDRPPLPTLDVAATRSLETSLADITPSVLRAHVHVLASDALAGRPTPSPQLDEAADYIEGVFRQLGLEPVVAGEFRQLVGCGEHNTRTSHKSANVIARLPGTSHGPTVLVTAHYDHLANLADGDDRIHNGANDNASGVAAMLEIARALRRLAQRPKFSVVFVAFCGEELGMHGSKHFVTNPPLALREIRAVFNLEMLGRAQAIDPPQAWVTGAEHSNLLALLQRSTQTHFVDAAEVGSEEGSAFHRSDNYPFAMAGIVAHTIAAGRIADGYYHSVTDEAASLDYPRMAALTRTIAQAVYAVAQDEFVPTWTAGVPQRE